MSSSPSVSDFLPELVCLGVDCVICSVLYAAYSITKIVEDEINCAPVLKLDSNLKETIKNQSLLLKDQSYIVPYAIIRGRVVAEDSTRLLQSQYSIDVKGVVQTSSIMEHKKNLSRIGFWYDSQKMIHKFINSVPFFLMGESGTSRIRVRDLSQASMIDTQVTHSDFSQSDSGLGSFIQGWLSGDIRTGLETTEGMVLEGMEMTGIGEIVLDKDSVITLRPPTLQPHLPFHLIRDSHEALIKVYGQSANSLKWSLFLFGGVGAAVGVFIGYRLYKKWKSERLNRENLEALREIRRNRSDPRGEQHTSTNPCVVCMTNEREVILLNCGHMCVCADCGEELLRRSSHCPICRSDIDKVSHVYI